MKGTSEGAHKAHCSFWPRPLFPHMHSFAIFGDTPPPPYFYAYGVLCTHTQHRLYYLALKLIIIIYFFQLADFKMKNCIIVR